MGQIGGNMNWLKIPVSEADKVHEISDNMIVDGLNIDKDRDIRDYLIYHIYDGFVYVYQGIFDLVNKNRINESSEKELQKWKDFNNGRWEVTNAVHWEV